MTNSIYRIRYIKGGSGSTPVRPADLVTACTKNDIDLSDLYVHLFLHFFLKVNFKQKPCI